MRTSCCTSFVDRPLAQDRAAELLAELEHVIAEFKRLRPPLTFKPERHLRLVDPVRLCAVCSKPVDHRRSHYLETVRGLITSSAWISLNDPKRTSPEFLGAIA
jgi:hypothetical protein